MTMRYFLTSLQIEGFRGINNEKIPLDIKFKTEKANSVFAPNGSGKSSIFDALCFAIKGKIPRFENMHKSENADHYYNNKFHSSGTAAINLTFQSDDARSSVSISVERAANGQRIVKSRDVSNPEAFLQSLDHECMLVDYHTFNNFVANSTLERGRTFSSLIGLSRISNIKQCLDSLSRSVSADLDLSVLRSERETVLGYINDQIKTINEYTTKYGGACTPKYNRETSEAFIISVLSANPFIKPWIDGKQLSELNFVELLDKVRTAEGGVLRQQLTKLINELSITEGYRHADSVDEIAELNLINKKLTDREKLLEKSKGEAFNNLYNYAKSIIDNDPLWDDNECPLCGSKLELNANNSSFYDILSLHIAEYELIQEHMNQAQSLWNIFSGKSRLLNAERSLINEEEMRICSIVDKNFSMGTVKSSNIKELITYVTDINKMISDVIGNLNGQIDLIKKQLPPSLVDTVEIIEKSRTASGTLDTINSNIDKYHKIEANIAARERWEKFINTASDKLSVAEAKLNNDICIEIEATASEFFKRIMENDSIKIALARSTKNQDLELSLSHFYTKGNLKALPVLSESYRNAFAISVFLAALVRRIGKSRFIILDDVTSSFDAGHQFMLMELLKETISTAGNPDGLQVVVLTHDGLLEKYLDKEDPLGAKWHNIKLQGLPPQGSVFAGQQNANRLRATAVDFLSNGLLEPAYPLIRQYLEYKLVEVIRKLNIPVPLDFAIRDDRKMVSNSLSCINNALDVHGKAGICILNAGQLRDIASLHVPSIIANWVNHYETASIASFTPYILLSVLDSIDNFTDCFKYDCSCNGNTVKRFYKDLSSKACSC